MNLTTVLSSAALVAAFGAQANTVLSFDFDTNSPDYKYGYTYSEFGTGTHDNGVFSPTGGVGGTAGLVTTFNTAPMSGGWAGIGTGLGDWRPAANYEVLVGLQRLSDVTLTLDARAGGLSGASAGVTFELKFEAPDNTLVPNDADGDTDVLLRITSSRTLTSDFQTFTSTLDSWTVAAGTVDQLKTYIGALGNINFNVAYDANGTMPAFGNDTGNTIAVDNYSITAVPEPSAVVLFAVAGTACLIRRRR